MISPYLHRVLEIAASQVGVREVGGQNRGPQVDNYLRCVGLDPTKGHYAWCAAFVSWVFEVTAKELKVPIPLHKTAWAPALWDRAPKSIRLPFPLPGSVFVIDKGVVKDANGKLHHSAHTGIVTAVNADGTVDTIEGNTNPGGSHDGDGVYRRTRKVADIAPGFVLYDAATKGKSENVV